MPITSARITSIALALSATVALSLSLGCAVGASANLPTTVQANQAATSTYTVAPQYFGMVVKSAAIVPVVQTGSRRLWDSGVTWAALEPAPGVFTWATLDREVQSAQASGAAVTLTLGMTPTWASSAPTASSTYGEGATASPVNLADWDAYLTAVAGRYQGQISGYEIWNAPGDGTYWSGSMTEMAALAAHAAAIVHAVDPAALVIAPAFTGAGLQQFLSAGGGPSVDVITLAPAISGQAPEATLASVSAIRATMNNTSVATKPLWNSQPVWTLPGTAVDAPTQAAFAARALILNASVGVQRLSWYAWDDSAAGSLRLTDDNGEPTAAATAYGVVEGWLSGATMNGCTADAASTWTCQIVRNGQAAWILWNPNQTVQSSSLGASTVTDLTGQTQPISGNVSVGASPVLLQ